MRTRPRISTSEIHFIISKMVSALRADATEVPTFKHKSSSTNGLPGGKVRPNFQNKKNFRKKIFSASTTTRKIRWIHWWYPFSNPSTITGDICILWPPRLLFPPRSNAASTTTRVADTSHWSTPCAAFSSLFYNDYCVVVGAWIVTGGTNAGIMKCVGDAVRQHTVACGSKKPITTIGIAVWGCVSNRHILDTNNNKVGTLSCRDLKLLGSQSWSPAGLSKGGGMALILMLCPNKLPYTPDDSKGQWRNRQEPWPTFLIGGKS